MSDRKSILNRVLNAESVGYSEKENFLDGKTKFDLRIKGRMGDVKYYPATCTLGPYEDEAVVLVVRIETKDI